MKSIVNTVRTRRIGLTLVLACITAIGLAATGKHDSMHGANHAGGMNSHHATSITPTLMGQYAFATLSEIVSMLRADANTDWSSVDLAALREHLVDMHNVTVSAQVSSEPIEGGARFDVISDEASVSESIRRMVTAHTAIMNSTNDNSAWQYSSQPITGGSRVLVSSSLPEEEQIIRALGFHGIMADGDHHSRHHWMLATGHDPH